MVADAHQGRISSERDYLKYDEISRGSTTDRWAMMTPGQSVVDFPGADISKSTYSKLSSGA